VQHPAQHGYPAAPATQRGYLQPVAADPSVGKARALSHRLAEENGLHVAHQPFEDHLVLVECQQPHDVPVVDLPQHLGLQKSNRLGVGVAMCTRTSCRKRTASCVLTFSFFKTFTAQSTPRNVPL
jgi:hypothetical protein